ncbi:host nuclease inhibitor protein [Klebsiella pneumoniae]|nr:host nuclease inhibitor protein [Klebsiella pneumoniae]
MEENKLPLIAFAWADGVIQFGYKVPFGALYISASPDEQDLRETVEVYARHSRTGDYMLVPGIPEAERKDDARLALDAFSRLVSSRLNTPGVKHGD